MDAREGIIVFSDEDRNQHKCGYGATAGKQLSKVAEEDYSANRFNCGSDAEVTKMAEMEAAEYVKKRVNVVVQVQMVDLVINGYSEQDVEPYDVANG